MPEPGSSSGQAGVGGGRWRVPGVRTGAASGKFGNPRSGARVNRPGRSYRSSSVQGDSGPCSAATLPRPDDIRRSWAILTRCRVFPISRGGGHHAVVAPSPPGHRRVGATPGSRPLPSCGRDPGLFPCCVAPTVMMTRGRPGAPETDPKRKVTRFRRSASYHSDDREQKHQLSNC